MRSLRALLLAALVLTISPVLVNAAVIVPGQPLDGCCVYVTTGGQAGQYGPFSGSESRYITLPSGQEEFATLSTLDGAYTPDSLSLDAASYTIGGNQGTANEFLTFTVTASSTFQYSWSQTADLGGGDAGLELMQQDFTAPSGYDSVFGCIGKGVGGPGPGGCALSPEFSGTVPNIANSSSLPTQGTFNLAPGEYTLFYEMNSGYDPNGGTPADAGDFSFNMSVVPLPATLPLLLSGLGAAGLLRKRSVSVAKRATGFSRKGERL
jgi:hypothetical protein